MPRAQLNRSRHVLLVFTDADKESLGDEETPVAVSYRAQRTWTLGDRCQYCDGIAADDYGGSRLASLEQTRVGDDGPDLLGNGLAAQGGYSCRSNLGFVA